MIKLEKKATYILKSKYHHESIIEKKQYYDIDEAMREFESYTPKFYLNKKDYSIIETISLYFSTEYGIKCYYKRIDPNTESIESNYIKELTSVN